MTKRFDKRDTGILAAAPAIRSPLVISFRFERNAERIVARREVMSASVDQLSAGEQLTVLPHTVAKPTRTDTVAATAWVQKRLMFEETPLRDVAEEFNRYNRRPLAIDDRELQKLKISGVYSSTDPASLINFLRSQSSYRVIETENQVRVIRREAN